jgi:hypothetical protein
MCVDQALQLAGSDSDANEHASRSQSTTDEMAGMGMRFSCTALTHMPQGHRGQCADRSHHGSKFQFKASSCPLTSVSMILYKRRTIPDPALCHHQQTAGKLQHAAPEPACVCWTRAQ